MGHFTISRHLRRASRPLAALLAAGLAAGNVSAQNANLDTTTFVALGEGLAAGMADFSLKETYQKQNFPALIAGQLHTAFPQPLFQPPGIGNAPGFPSIEVSLPARGQTTAREGFPPGLFVFNLSVPNMKVADAVGRRPTRPLIQQANIQQTTLNMILGYPTLSFNNSVPVWSQLEYAQAMFPTLALVELGYSDILDAAVNGDPTLLPDVAQFQTNYTKIVSTMRALFADVIVTTVPNPLDTAYFTSLNSAPRLLGAPAGVLQNLYSLKSDDLLTIPGLNAVGNQLSKGVIGTLPNGSVMSAATASQITARVTALNAAIRTVATANGAVVYDLNAFFAKVKTQGAVVGTKTFTADYLGGFYSLDGYYPGTTAHALIANEVLALLNQAFKKSYAAVDVSAVMADDPAGSYVASR